MEEQSGTGIGMVAGLPVLAVFRGIVAWFVRLLIKGTGDWASAMWCSFCSPSKPSSEPEP